MVPHTPSHRAVAPWGAPPGTVVSAWSVELERALATLSQTRRQKKKSTQGSADAALGVFAGVHRSLSPGGRRIRLVHSAPGTVADVQEKLPVVSGAK